MSLNLHFLAIEHDDAAMLLSDPTSIDDFVESERGAVLQLVVTGRWEVLPKALDGLGFRSSQFIDEVLSNGCEFVESDLVFRQAEEFRSLDLGHIDQEIQRLSRSPADFTEQSTAVRSLSRFYMQASTRSLAMLIFAM